MLIYLAGAISWYYQNKQFERCMIWRRLIKDEINRINKETNSNFKVFNPCDNFSSNINYNHKSIVKQNMYYLKKSDIMLVNGEDGSIFGYSHIDTMIDECFHLNSTGMYNAINYLSGLYNQKC